MYKVHLGGRCRCVNRIRQTRKLRRSTNSIISTTIYKGVSSIVSIVRVQNQRIRTKYCIRDCRSSASPFNQKEALRASSSFFCFSISTIIWAKTSPCVVLSFWAGGFALLVVAFTVAEVPSPLSSVVAFADVAPGLPIYFVKQTGARWPTFLQWLQTSLS